MPLAVTAIHYRFNPTLVRLRRSIAWSVSRFRRCFNPTLVRLRLLSMLTQLPSDPQFQSHAGSIEAIIEMWVESSLIQFQSHAGSIEAWGILPP